MPSPRGGHLELHGERPRRRHLLHHRPETIVSTRGCRCGGRPHWLFRPLFRFQGASDRVAGPRAGRTRIPARDTLETDSPLSEERLAIRRPSNRFLGGDAPYRSRSSDATRHMAGRPGGPLGALGTHRCGPRTTPYRQRLTHATSWTATRDAVGFIPRRRTSPRNGASSPAEPWPIDRATDPRW